jgi:hypothetical protein
MQNGIFKSSWAAVVEAVFTAAFFAVATAFGQIVLSGNFDIFTANWLLIGHNMANVGFIAGVTWFVKDWLSTNSGSFLGVMPNTTPSQS